MTHLNSGRRVRDPNAEGVREVCEDTLVAVENVKAQVGEKIKFQM
jgi:hypothetical protein